MVMAELDKKYIPGSDADCEDIFTFPYIIDKNTVDFIKSHKQIMFIVRGFPGTGKNSLKKMISAQYPNSTICSADNYFENTFAPQMRSRDTLRESHYYCHRKVLNACKKQSHPIIVCNTHVKKRELEEYLKYAATYNYTIIMAITSHKFKVTPEILAKSNTKGLDVSYFRNRIRQWENIIPVFTGWFLNKDDSTFLFILVQNILKLLLKDKRFCEFFDSSRKDSILDYYKAKRLLFCVAAYGQNNRGSEIKAYYLSEEFLEHYAKSFEIAVVAFLITTSDILALVHLDDVMKKLISKPEKVEKLTHLDDDMDNIIAGLESISFGDPNLLDYSKTVALNSFSSSSPAHPKESNDLLQTIKLDDCSFIHIAQHKEEMFCPFKVEKHMIECIKKNVDSDGIINIEKFESMEDGYKICHLPNNAWLVMLPNFCFRSIFTGLYT